MLVPMNAVEFQMVLDLMNEVQLCLEKILISLSRIHTQHIIG